MPAPASMRIASPNDRPSVEARRSTASNCSRVWLNRAWSTSTHLPRIKAKPVRMGKEPLDLGRRQRLAVERHLHLEVEKSIDARVDGGLPPTVAFTWGRAGRFMRQLAGMRTTTPALSSAGASLRIAALARAPAQRVKDIARIDHRLQPLAGLGGTLDRHQQ